MATAAIGQGDVYGAASKPFLKDRDRPEAIYGGRMSAASVCLPLLTGAKKDPAGRMQCHLCALKHSLACCHSLEGLPPGRVHEVKVQCQASSGQKMGQACEMDQTRCSWEQSANCDQLLIPVGLRNGA